MYTIKTNYETSIEVKKSIFIACLYKVYNKDDVKKYLKKVKEEHKDATHYCYSYIIDDIKNKSDDNEPSGTAGIPIMDVLDKRKLNYILCVVVRYFGGIKLGAGGLVRTYSKAVRDAIDQVELVTLTDGYLVEIKTDYSNIKRLDYILKDLVILNKKFETNVVYRVLIEKEKLESLSEFEISIIDNVKIEKEKL